MRFLPALLATVAVATAQSPLTTTFVNNGAGSVGGGVYFTLTGLNPAGVSINQIDLNLNSVAGTAGTIEVFVKAQTSIPIAPITNWIPVGGQNPVVSAGPHLPSLVPLATPIGVGFGCTIGVGIRANGVAHSYTNGVGAYPVPGNIFANADLSLNAGQSSNVAFVGVGFTPRIVNCRLNYTIGGACPPFATVTPQGPGCERRFTSFYELLAAPAFDLSAGWLVLTNTTPPPPAAASYVVQFNPVCPLFPIGLLGPAATVPLGDDSQSVAGTMGLVVGSNGWVALAAGNSDSATPTVPVLLSNPAAGWYSWKDLNPAAVGSGQVWYEEDAAGRQARITFDGVYVFGGTTAADACYIQFTYNWNTGDMIISWGAVSLAGTNWLVGHSPGGASLDPGATNLSTLLVPTVLTSTVDATPLSLVSIGRPVQGAAAVSFNVTTGNIPASALIHIGILGLARPLFPLAILGAPACFLNASADVLIGPALGPFPPTFTWTAMNLPALPPSFTGFQFDVQGAILGTPWNGAFGLGLLTSNGLKCVVGTL